MVQSAGYVHSTFTRDFAWLIVLQVKTNLRGSSLPRSAFRNIRSSSPSQPLPLTPSNLANNNIAALAHERRDSLISYGSSTSSSLYPQSTSTGSHPESSIGPHSLQDQDDDASSFSPRIVTFSEKEAVYLVLELAPEGELFNHIVMKNKLTEDEARHLFIQLFQGIKYLVCDPTIPAICNCH